MQTRLFIKISLILPILLLINIILFFFVSGDQRQSRGVYFLKQASPYYDLLSNTLKNIEILNAKERDVTSDNKVEFILVVRNSACPSCQKRLLIFQGEKMIFETAVSSSNLSFDNNNVIVLNGNEKVYQWVNNQFKEKPD